MVTISDILKTVIASLPPINIGGTDYTVQFFEGILDDAKEQMNTYKRSNKLVYPCVWLIRDFPKIESANRIAVTGLQLILLVDTKGSFQAPERLENTIDAYLIPLKNNLVKALRLAGCLVENPQTVTDLTFLGNANANIPSANPKQNARIFADYLDGVKLLINLSYDKTLKLTCYDYR